MWTLWDFWRDATLAGFIRVIIILISSALLDNKDETLMRYYNVSLFRVYVLIL